MVAAGLRQNGKPSKSNAPSHSIHLNTEPGTAPGNRQTYTFRISERTKAGLERAKAEGKTLGRRTGQRMKGTAKRIKPVQQPRAEGNSFNAIGQQLDISKQRAAQLFAMPD